MKRAERRAQIKRVAAARQRFDYRGVSENELASRHPFDCGRGGCLCCHASKLLYKGSRRASEARKWRREQSF